MSYDCIIYIYIYTSLIDLKKNNLNEELKASSEFIDSRERESLTLLLQSAVD